MKAGILGSGDVGRVLATAFLKEGHEVMLGSRTTTKDEVVKWQQENPGGQTGTFAEAAAFGEVIVLAVKGTVVKEVIDLAGKANLAGKTLIDATNPIANEAPVNGVLKYFTTMDESLMEQIQAYIPEANVVKAFSCVGNPFMYKPDFPGGTPTMFICGNDDTAKATVTNILDSFGWETEDMGKAEAARAIEPLCILWCLPGFVRNQWQHAFKLLKK
jgi:8-hydroxy-5-deazaflavin:NADPH oxidoreductase